MAPAPAASSFAFLAALLVSPELLIITGFFKVNPAKVVFKSAMVIIVNGFFNESVTSLIQLLINSFPEDFTSYSYQCTALFNGQMIVMGHSH